MRRVDARSRLLICMIMITHDFSLISIDATSVSLSLSLLLLLLLLETRNFIENMDKNDSAMTKGGSQKLINLEGEAHHSKWKITRDNKT